MFKPILENEATGKVKEVFEDIKSARKIQKSQIFGNILQIVLKL